MKTKYVFEPGDISTVPDWYRGYVKTLDGRDFLELLKDHFISTPEFFKSITSNMHNFAYAPGK